jgi:hypothetical protein
VVYRLYVLRLKFYIRFSTTWCQLHAQLSNPSWFDRPNIWRIVAGTALPYHFIFHILLQMGDEFHQYHYYHHHLAVKATSNISQIILQKQSFWKALNVIYLLLPVWRDQWVPHHHTLLKVLHCSTTLRSWSISTLCSFTMSPNF